MERLTKRTETGGIRYTRHNIYEEDVVEKLAEYEELEEQGLLHKAPLKNGTLIWIVVDDYVDEEAYLICESYQYGYSEYMYGKYNEDFFENKEQAEKMIKGLNGEFDK